MDEPLLPSEDAWLDHAVDHVDAAIGLDERDGHLEPLGDFDQDIENIDWLREDSAKISFAKNEEKRESSEVKRQERLQRNRASAKRSRESKRAVQDALFAENRRLKTENSVLRNRLMALCYPAAPEFFSWTPPKILLPAPPRKS